MIRGLLLLVPIKIGIKEIKNDSRVRVWVGMRRKRKIMNVLGGVFDGLG